MLPIVAGPQDLNKALRMQIFEDAADVANTVTLLFMARAIHLLALAALKETRRAPDRTDSP